jgi:hypothetical protein
MCVIARGSVALVAYTCDMADFTRECECALCGRRYVITGVSANPGNETQFAMEFPCACGSLAVAHLPGSVNRERLRVEPVPIGIRG